MVNGQKGAGSRDFLLGGRGQQVMDSRGEPAESGRMTRRHK